MVDIDTVGSHSEGLERRPLRGEDRSGLDLTVEL